MARPRSTPVVRLSQPDQLGEAVTAHRDVLDAACAGFFLDAAEREDATQSAILSALRRFDAVRDDILGYLRWRIRRNCRNLSRRRDALTGYALIEPGSEGDPAEIATDRHLLATALPQLSETDRRLLAYDISGYTDREIAELLGKQRVAVRVALLRARQRARELCRDALGGLVVAFPRLRRLVMTLRPRSVLEPGLVDTLASLAIVILFSGGPSAVSAPPPAPLTTSPVHAAVATPPAASWVGRTVHVATGANHAMPSAAASPTMAPRPRDAATETPEDVRVTTAASPPRASGAGPAAIVAVGTGRTCQCQVLLQSLDGGVSWAAPANGPPIVLNQLVLPPSYPADPRIFGSNADPAVPPYEAASFGAPFNSLALPGGQVAVTADFDAGDPRLFVAGQTGVWSLDLATSSPLATPHLEVGYASSSGAVAALATPPAQPSGPSVLAWVPNLAVVPGSLTPPHLSATLMACPSRGLCAPQADIAGLPQFLTVGADAPDTVVAYAWASSSVFVSRDGGRLFTSTPLPAAGVFTASMVVMGATGEVWGSFTHGAEGGEVARLGETGSWVDATRGDLLLQSRPGTLVVVDAHRLVDALPGTGYRCTTTDGFVWTPRCPRT